MMNNNWVNVPIPKTYMIRKNVYQCKVCGREFASFFSDGNDLVKFVENNGKEIRWLPTFERGGYLDLMSALVPGYKEGQNITMFDAKKFEKLFKEIQEPSKSGNYFSVAVGCRCPDCNSDKKELISEEILDSPELEWLRYKS
jgi:rubredoxin